MNLDDILQGLPKDRYDKLIKDAPNSLGVSDRYLRTVRKKDFSIRPKGAASLLKKVWNEIPDNKKIEIVNGIIDKS